MTGVCGLRTYFLRLPAAKPNLFRRHRCLFSTCSDATLKRTKQKVIVISGPTGSGKSRLALELAKRLNGEIISADSVQVYQGLDVGSAKPSLSDQKDVPHHLLDILHPYEEYSVGQFYEDAREATKSILDKGRVPIVAGGTGLYLRWFVYGKPDVPRASLEISSETYSELEHLERSGDWDAAVELVVKAGDPKVQLIPTNDWYRLRRSLEIIKIATKRQVQGTFLQLSKKGLQLAKNEYLRSSGSPPSAFLVPYDSFRELSGSSLREDSHDVNSHDIDALEGSKSEDLDYDFICFFLSTSRLDLYRSIDYRCEVMLSEPDGLLSEAKWLLDLGLLPNSNSATRAIGYRQAMEFLLNCREGDGRSSSGDFFSFLSEFQKASRNFSKRQMTWFRNEQIYHWLNASRPLEEVLNFICDAYHDKSGTIVVPELLTMKKDVRSRKEIAELKAYRPQNRYFESRVDCSDILDWIWRTQEVKQSC